MARIMHGVDKMMAAAVIHGATFWAVSAALGQEGGTEAAPQETVKQRTPMEMLRAENEELRAMLDALRAELAKSNLERDTAARELSELQQFLAEHRDLGTDFAQYKDVKAIAEKEANRKAAEEARAKRAAEQAAKDVKRKEARAAKQQAEAQSKRVAQYRERGFSPVGLEVYISKWAYFYRTKDTQQTRVDWDPYIGRFLRPSYGTEIEYSSMTVSGSVLNGTKQVRNIGVAITFFDEHGQQVGHEIVEVANARPDVPYPFTSTIEMALNKPFDSSSVYVLYADEVMEEGEASTTTGSGTASAGAAPGEPAMQGENGKP